MNVAKNKVLSQLTPLVTAIISNRPQSILHFIREYSSKNMLPQQDIKNHAKNQYHQNNISIKQHHLKEEIQEKNNNASSRINHRKGIRGQVYGKYNKLQQIRLKMQKNCSAQEIVSITSILRNSFIFKHVGVKNLEKITKCIEIKQVQKEEILIRQGQYSQNMYIVKSGLFNCIKMKQNSTEKTLIRTYKVNQVFGQLNLLYKTISPCQIKCSTSKSSVYCLKKRNFNYLIKTLEENKKKKYDYILKRIQFLSGNPGNRLQTIADIIEERLYQSGQFIFQQGQQINRTFIVLQGEVRLIEVQDGKQKIIKIYQNEDYFAQSCLIRTYRFKYSAICSSTSIILSIDRQSFKRIMGSVEDILALNIKNYKQIYIQTKHNSVSQKDDKLNAEDCQQTLSSKSKTLNQNLVKRLI